MAEVRIKDIDEHEVDTILADDIDFEGQLTFKKPLMIRGKFKGEIRSESALYVGEKAVVEAKVESSLVSSKGRIKGDITGHSRVELFSSAQVDGDIATPDFVVESGCKFNGHCNMTGQKRTGQPHQQGQAPGHSAQHGQQQGPKPQGQSSQPAQGQQPAVQPPGQQQGLKPQGQPGQSPQGQQQGQRPQGQPGQHPPGQQQSNPQNPQQSGNR